MRITLEIPDDLATHLFGPDKDPARAALELFAIEGYRTQHLSEHQIRLMLGFQTRMEVHALLAQHDVCLDYSQADLEVDHQTAAFLHSQRAVEAFQEAG